MSASASVVESIPPSVLAGLVLGGLFTVFAAGLFVVGERWFPSRYGTEPRTYSGEDRRRTEIRDYLREIGERYAEDHPVAGTSVAFYLPERDVAVTFDAHAFFRIQNTTETVVILVEHEMPGRHLGRRLPFEVPEIRTDATDFQETVRIAYESLGLPRTASRSEIKSAYRDRVKDVHPDHGGDEESFRQLQEAYVTAKEHAD
ncbi:J domain-containing protein [Natronoglomus mannanivorans]|uniref:J domain-containing protein n=1 Tax=Natronoglomus mannanivorans TaxID=2979990 RepID=A0AAP2YYL2_9EURY|nr:J domain-containing protein [Halobacteria archaeon AArc-xg1-1]